jgi:hypothetical protein
MADTAKDLATADSGVRKRIVPSRDDQQVPGLDTGWYWVTLWDRVSQTAKWFPARWTGSGWVFPNMDPTYIYESPITDRGIAIYTPSTSVEPPSEFPVDGSYWWYKTKAQPDTWTIGFGVGEQMIWGESGGDSISLDDIAVVDGSGGLVPNTNTPLITGWYWVKLWVSNRQQAEWCPGRWTGNEWVLPGFAFDDLPNSSIINFGGLMFMPSSAVAPPPEVTGYCWYKAKAQPDTWMVGWGCGNYLLWGAGTLCSISLDEIAVVSQEPVTAPDY